MAAKVNIKFVALLAVAVAVVAGAVLYVGARTYIKSAEEHFATGEEMEAKGDWEAAARSYAKATNKAQGRVEYVKKWINALEHITPPSVQLYRDRFTGEYLMALRGLAAAQPTDVSAQKAVLDLSMIQFRVFGAQPTQWEGFIKQADEVIAQFRGAEQSAAPLRRYRGVAQTNWAAVAASVPDDVLTKAKEDLEAAVSAEPTSAEAMSDLGEWYRVAAQRATQRRETEKAAELTREGMQRLEAFVTQNAVVVPALWTLTNMQMAEAARTAPPNLSFREQVTLHHPRIRRLYEQVLAEPSGALDRMLVYKIGALMVAAGYPEVGPAIGRMMDHAGSSKADDVFLIFHRGELELATGQHEAAFATLDRLVKMPDRPMSFDGWFLFVLREEAMHRQASALLALSRTGTDEAKRKDALARAKSMRDQIAERFGKSPALNLLDAKLHYSQGEFIEARRLLSTYTTQRPEDVGAMKLLADVLLRQGQAGAARLTLEDVLKRNPTDMGAVVNLAETLEALSLFKEAAAKYEEALAIDPGNAAIEERIRRLRMVAAAERSDDPLVRALAVASEKITASPPDTAGALKLVQDLFRDLKKDDKLDSRSALAIAQTLLLLEDRAGALAALDTVKEQDNALVKALRTQIENPDPMDARISIIDQSQLTDFVKAMLRYQTYRRFNKAAEAKAELEKGRAIEPDNALMLSADFDEAMMAGDLSTAERLAEEAARRNVDKANGAIFRIRLEQAKGRTATAMALAQQMVDQDPLNQLGHRLVGALRLQEGKFTDALAAFEKAIQINPQDAENVKGKVRALVSLGKVPDALLFVRGVRGQVMFDSELSDMLLRLEGDAGKADFAIEQRRRTFERNPADSENVVELASLLLKRQQWEDARRFIDLAKQAGTDFRVMQLSATWYLRQNDLPKARAEWEAYIASLPDDKRDGMLYVAFAEFLASAGDLASARQILEANRSRQSADQAEIDRELGDLCFHAQDWQGAIDNLERARKNIAKDDGNRVRYRIIDAHIRLKNYDDAQRLCDEASAAGIPDDVSLMLLRAQVAMGKGDPAGARRFVDRAVAIEPNNPLGFYKRAEFIATQLNQLRQDAGGTIPGDKVAEVKQLLADAQSDLETAVRLNPGLAQARKLLSEVLITGNKLDEAGKLLADGLRIDPRNALLRRDLIQLLLARGKADEALALIKEGADQDKSPQWRLMAGDVLRNKGEVDKAVAEYDAAWQAGARSPQLARVFSETLLMVPRPDGERILRILNDPEVKTGDWSALLSMRAKVTFLVGRPADADTDMRAAFAKLDTENPAVVGLFFQDLGDMFSGRVAEMVRFMESVKPAEGFNPPIRVQIIRYKLTDARLAQEALSELDALVATTPNKAAVHVALRQLGDLMYGQKNFAVAAEVYRRVLAVKPDDHDTMNNLAYTLCKHLDRCQEALPFAEMSASNMASNSNVLDTLAIVYLALGRVADAESTLMRASDLAGSPRQQVPVYIHLGQVWLAKNDRMRAADWLERADREMTRDQALRLLFGSEYDDVKRKVAGGR